MQNVNDKNIHKLAVKKQYNKTYSNFFSNKYFEIEVGFSMQNCCLENIQVYKSYLVYFCQKKYVSLALMFVKHQQKIVKIIHLSKFNSHRFEYIFSTSFQGRIWLECQSNRQPPFSQPQISQCIHVKFCICTRLSCCNFLYNVKSGYHI